MPLPPMMPRIALVMALQRFRWKTKGPETGPQRQEIFRGSMDGGPHLLLGEVEQPRQHDEEDDDLEADALALHELGLRRPHQERRDVLRVLDQSLRRAVIVGHLPIGQRRRHGDVWPGKYSL